jgi:hypothetical protein
LETLLIKIKILFPGLIGALLASITGPARDIKSRFIGFVFGFCVASYGTDPLLNFFSLSHDTYQSGCGFILGYFGLSVSDAVMKFIRETDFSGIVKSKFGGGQ